MPPSTPRLPRLLACTIIALCLVVAGAVPPASAGDRGATLETDPDELEADPGETVTVDVVVASDGDTFGNGVADVRFDLTYDESVLTEAEVERGSWLADGDADVDGSTDVDEEAGVISIAQERDPAGDGVTGTGTVATITWTVADDAEPTDAELAFDEADIAVSTGHQQAVWDRTATVEVDGGGTADGESGDGESDDADDPDGVTLGDSDEVAGESDDGEDGDGEGAEADADADSPTDGDDGSDESDEDDESGEGDGSDDDDDGDDSSALDAVPGFGMALALAAVVATVFALVILTRTGANR
ncbi:cohesin domain-containing protein [Natrialbaceae archaeon GCM10025810]|uniref:cohesin domain-containing protein n=1 Tax=Halovalidus salilacus TaxID=3075124 RepID=UPI0036130A0B